MINEFKFQFIAPLKYKYGFVKITLIVHAALLALMFIATFVLKYAFDISPKILNVTAGLEYSIALNIIFIFTSSFYKQYRDSSAQFRITLGSSYEKQMMVTALMSIIIIAIQSTPALVLTLLANHMSASNCIQLYICIICMAPVLYFIYMFICGVSGRSTLSENALPMLLGLFVYFFVDGLSEEDVKLFMIHFSDLSKLWFYVPVLLAIFNLAGVWFILPKLKWMRQTREKVQMNM